MEHPSDKDLQNESAFNCFRCGECCRLPVYVNYEEADRIAEYAVLPREEFTIEFWGKSESSEECLVIKQKNGDCFFLCTATDSREKYCRIYEVRPEVCLEFAPSPACQECKEGLAKFWNITVNSSGAFEGSEKQINAFKTFLKTIIRG
jgi:Fe-S-cluster containining protein